MNDEGLEPKVIFIWEQPGDAALKCGFEVVELTIPAEMKTGEIANLAIKIKNTSSFNWVKTGTESVSLTYHWVNPHGQYEVFRADITSLKKEIKVGEVSANQTLQVRAPEIPGKFTFKLDLILKDKWFALEGNSKYERPVNITGDVRVYDEEGVLVINDGAEYANDTNLSLGFGELKFQPNSPEAAFLYKYAQGGRSTDNWGPWGLINDSKLKYNAGIAEPFVD